MRNRNVTVALPCLVVCAVVGALSIRSDVGQAVLNAAVGVLSGLLGWRGVRRNRPRAGGGWWLICAGLVLNSLGALVEVYYVRISPDASPTPADLFYLALYPGVGAGMLLLARSRRRQVVGGGALDAAALSIALGLLCWVVLIRPASPDPSMSLLGRVVSYSYPVGDLALLVILGRLLSMARLSYPIVLLSTGLGCFLGGDVAWSAINQLGLEVSSPVWNGLLAAVFMIGYAFCGAAAAAEPATRPPVAVRKQGKADVSTRLFVVLICSALVPPIVLLIEAAFGDVPDTVAIGVCAVCLSFLVVARLIQLVRTLETQSTRLRDLSLTDALTDLPNRRHFHAAVGEVVADIRAGRARTAALLLIDLDRFKEINDSLGHHVGDALLRQVGPRLAEALRPDDLVARLGGDEFALLLPDADGAAAADLAGRVLSALRRPFDLQEVAGLGLHVDASIGIALCPEHADGVSGLLQHADIAMYRAKAAHSGYEISAGDLDGADRHRLETIEQLRVALDTDQIVLHYQPKIDLARRVVTGVEALVRWQHPTRGLLYPDAFLPLAEQSGLMRRLTLTVLQIALEQADEWRRAGHELSVAVNLSASNLLDVQLPEQVDLLLAALDLPASLLELEITETVLMADPARAHQVLHALRALGIRIAVDDFGTGYSSLSYLQDLPVDDLKLDRSFVMRSATDERSAAIVRSTVGLAHALDMRIIAEGVENAQVLDQLTATGCDLAQGYHLSRPQPSSPRGWGNSNTRRPGVQLAGPAAQQGHRDTPGALPSGPRGHEPNGRSAAGGRPSTAGSVTAGEGVERPPAGCRSGVLAPYRLDPYHQTPGCRCRLPRWSR